MKKSKLFCVALSAVLSAVYFTGCKDLIDAILEETAEKERGYEMVSATETVTWNYSSTNQIFEVTPEVNKVIIKGNVSGKKAYLVRRNTGIQADIDKSDVRGNVDSGSRSAVTELVDLSDLKLPEPEFRRFHAPEVVVDEAAARSAVSANVNFSVTPINRTVGTTKKIWVDNNVNINSFEQKDATLRAVGTYCNVWIVDTYYTEGDSTGSKVNKKTAEDFAKKFDAMYLMITNVFGEESDSIFDYTKPRIENYGVALTPLTEVSDTGNKINIVIYDIGNDYASSKKCGVLGYFYSKDYFYGVPTGAASYSNVGKYFYIDAPYIISNFNDTVSTLAHEFQHMVNYNQKNINEDCDDVPSAAYNEMLSMLCEDMMQSYLGIPDNDSPKGRLQSFNYSYFISGINDYIEDNSTVSYSTNYAFGSWLARQYGGAELVKWFSQSPYVDEESIETAVQYITDNDSLDFETLFQQFLLAITGSSKYTHNKNAAQTMSYGTYKYPMTAINLWDDAYGYNNPSIVKQLRGSVIDGFDWRGPVIFKRNIGVTLPAHNGISIHELDISENTVEFSRIGPATQKIYLIIQ